LDRTVFVENKRLEDVAAETGTWTTRDGGGVPEECLLATWTGEWEDTLDLTTARVARQDLTSPWTLDRRAAVEKTDGRVAVSAGVGGGNVVLALTVEKVRRFGLVVDEVKGG